LIDTARQNLHLAITSFSLSFLAFDSFLPLQDYLLRPSHIIAFINAIPERRNAIILLTTCGIFVFVPTLCFILEDKRHMKRFIILVTVVVGCCLGVTLALEREVSCSPSV
jgi:uncharacterized membrane protein